MLDGLTVFVTGGSQGLGRSIAEECVARGARVVAAARSEGIYETVEGIGVPERTLAVETDVTDPDSVAAGVDAAVEAFGGIDCVVNNAGIAGPTASNEEVSVAEWEETLGVNVIGAALVTRYATPFLRESEQASIVNISSIGGKRPYANRGPYAASKMGLIGLTRSWAFELAPDGVTVNAVCPGPVRGERIRGVFQRMADRDGVSYEEAEGRVLERQAIPELVEPAEVASLTVYLASEHARHITAQDINISSGGAWY